uniref:Uncharacterized protein n=1 Tax=Rhizophora mucronata TaxID=61149 RepID=A0A2P2PZY8_RHIMU
MSIVPSEKEWTDAADPQRKGKQSIRGAET